MKVKIGSSEVIHFVGIGGIGTSGLAQIMYNMGFKIQGSDLVQNKNTERLKKFGIRIFIGHKKQNINDATMLVISSAIKKNNEECKKTCYNDVSMCNVHIKASTNNKIK